MCPSHRTVRLERPAIAVFRLEDREAKRHLKCCCLSDYMASTSQKPVILILNKSHIVFLGMDDKTNRTELAGLIPGAYTNFNIMEKLGAYKKESLHVNSIVKLVQYISEKHHDISLLITSVCHYLIYKENLCFISINITSVVTKTSKLIKYIVLRSMNYHQLNASLCTTIYG